MLRFHAVIALALALGLAGCLQVSTPPLPQPAPVPWPHEAGDLPPDPAIVWGRLDNGLRYAILPHENPRRRASVCLVVQAGSYQENSGELGYAHFVEHMAFRDTRDFPGDAAIKTLQRLGIAFGPHVAADTGIFQTDFRFNNLPTDDPVALPTGLKILRSMADGILFEKNAVEHERGVIFSEERSRNGMMAGLWQDQLEFLPPADDNPRWSELATAFEKTRLTRRPVIGTDKILGAATARKLRAFYDRWYRPERMILAVSGDLVPAEAEAMIQQTFSSLVARGPAPADVAIEDTPARSPQESAPAVYVESLTAETALRVALGVAVVQPGPDTAERRRQILVREVALAMLEHRLSRAANAPGAPFTTTDTELSHFVPGHELVLLRANCPPALWPKALTALDTQLRSACEFGFGAAEFESEVKATTANAATAVRQAAIESSAILARSLAYTVARGVVFTSAEEDRRRTESELATLTAERCRTALREIFPTDKVFAALSGTFAAAQPEVAAVRQTLHESQAVAAPDLRARADAKPFPYTDFGPAGAVAKRNHDAALDADLIEFANGVRLNLKRTDFEPGRMQLVVRFGSGRLACPRTNPAWTWECSYR